MKKKPARANMALIVLLYLPAIAFIGYGIYMVIYSLTYIQYYTNSTNVALENMIQYVVTSSAVYLGIGVLLLAAAVILNGFNQLYRTLCDLSNGRPSAMEATEPFIDDGEQLVFSMEEITKQTEKASYDTDPLKEEQAEDQVPVPHTEAERIALEPQDQPEHTEAERIAQKPQDQPEHTEAERITQKPQDQPEHTEAERIAQKPQDQPEHTEAERIVQEPQDQPEHTEAERITQKPQDQAEQEAREQKRREQEAKQQEEIRRLEREIFGDDIPIRKPPLKAEPAEAPPAPPEQVNLSDPFSPEDAELFPEKISSSIIKDIFETR